jgi:hypothetical protein
MGKTSRKKFDSSGVSYLKVGLALVLIVAVMDYSIALLQDYNPYLASWVGLGIVALGMLYLYHTIFYAMAQYVYKIIYSDLIIERVISKTNHTTYSVDFKCIRKFVPYMDMKEGIKIKRRNHYVKNRNKNEWYFLEFTKDDETIRLVIEPGRDMAKTIKERLTDHENS